MWDNITPLQLLNTMPKELEKEHLEKLQNLFVADKYKNQIISGEGDLCGQYAPFCTECDKGNEFPCATAYVNFMKAQGIDISIATDSEPLDNAADEPDENAEEEIASSAEEESANDVDGASEQEEKPEKTKIRIAIARKKTLL